MAWMIATSRRGDRPVAVGPTFVVASSDKGGAEEEEEEEAASVCLPACLPSFLPPFSHHPELLPDPYRARLPVGKSTKDFHGH